MEQKLLSICAMEGGVVPRSLAKMSYEAASGTVI
jgi:hypothetical protein